MDTRRQTRFKRYLESAALLLGLLFSGWAPASAQGAAPAVTSDSSLAGQLSRATHEKFAPESLLASFLASDPTIQNQALAIAAQVAREAPSITQQKGAVAESAGTTTLAEKTGLAELLNLAIEQGAITKTTSGTSYTLQTTPYLLLSGFGAQDVPALWEKSELSRQIGLSATFNQTAGSTDASSNNFERGEVKYTYGARTPRSRGFMEQIRQQLAAQIDPSSGAAATHINLFWSSVEKHIPDARLHLQATFNTWWNSKPKPIPLKDLVDELHRELDPLLPQLNADDLLQLRDLASALGAEDSALASASQFVTAAAKRYVDASHYEASIAYAFQRDATISDFSDFKLLYSYKTSINLSTELNGEVMLNDRSTAANGTRLERLRGYAFEADLTTGKFANDAADFTAAAKLTRPTGGLRDERSVQGKLDLYLLRGVTVPVSLSYTNHTDDPTQPNRSHVRVNVGVSLDADALIGVASKGASNPPS